MWRILQWLNGFLGRLIYRFLGCVTALIALLTLRGMWHSLADWDGAPSWLTLMYGVGAGLAIWATTYCFSRQRTLGEFVDGLDSSSDF